MLYPLDEVVSSTGSDEEEKGKEEKSMWNKYLKSASGTLRRSAKRFSTRARLITSTPPPAPSSSNIVRFGSNVTHDEDEEDDEDEDSQSETTETDKLVESDRESESEDTSNSRQTEKDEELQDEYTDDGAYIIHGSHGRGLQLAWNNDEDQSSGEESETGSDDGEESYDEEESSEEGSFAEEETYTDNATDLSERSKPQKPTTAIVNALLGTLLLWSCVDSCIG